MTINELVESVIETLVAANTLAGVPIIAEDKGDVDAKLALEIAQQQFCVMVGWNGFTPVKQSEEVILGNTEIVVSIFEKPTVNRTSEGGETIFSAAQKVAKALTYAQADGMNCPLFFRRITPISEFDKTGVVTCDVVFETKAEL